jgi:diaminopimelate epimerase
MAMRMRFTKMNGAGNDFILVDNRDRSVVVTPKQVARLCDRHSGVGADGLVLLTPCASGKADWAWDFYNSDGSAAEMCGNAARCFGRFVARLTGSGQPFTFETVAGVIKAAPQAGSGRVTVSLTEPRDLRLNETVALSTGKNTLHSLNTGVPHAVLFVENADEAMVSDLGREIRRHPHYAPRGTNVNFVQPLGANLIRVRTYERGVEGETLACGTGVTASALITASLREASSPVRVRVQSGEELEVSFRRENGSFKDVQLSGPADFVFEGEIDV